MKSNKGIFSNFDTSATAVPLYDSWGPADYWGCNDWINWHKSLVNAYGVDKANEIWTNAWLDGLSSIAGGRGKAPGSNYIVDSVPLDCRSFDSGFRNYIDKFPVVYNTVFSGLAGFIAKPIGGSVAVLQNVGSGITNVSKVLKYLLPVVIIVFTGIVAYKFYKK